MNLKPKCFSLMLGYTESIYSERINHRTLSKQTTKPFSIRIRVWNQFMRNDLGNGLNRKYFSFYFLRVLSYPTKSECIAWLPSTKFHFTMECTDFMLAFPEKCCHAWIWIKFSPQKHDDDDDDVKFNSLYGSQTLRWVSTK